eukprot:7944868-Lingulodinium_polyedra.AAC.1
MQKKGTTEQLTPEEAGVAEDEALEELFDKLERARPDLKGLAPARLPDFKAMPRARGDSWQGQVNRHGHAQQWCKDHGLQQTKAFSIDRLGFDTARTLAEGWAARMQFLYDSETAGLLSTPAQAVAMMASFEEPEAFVDLLLGATGELKECGDGIRALMVEAII